MSSSARELSPSDADYGVIKAAHTPGPWVFSFESVDPEWAVVTTLGGSVVANVNADHRQEANARLIAAAPDLLAEARELCAILDHHGVSDGEGSICYDHEAIGEEVSRRHESLTTAIAKAVSQ